MKKNLELINALKKCVLPARGIAPDYTPLIEKIGDSSVVLIGEASHGTHEFYRERALITQLLITEKGFNAVAIEGDWPSAYRINEFIRGKNSVRLPHTNSNNPEAALSEFKRFPAWMWRNTVLVEFIEWLKEHTAQRKDDGVYFVGLDLYSLHRSIEMVVDYLDKIDPLAAQKARERYACFDHYHNDPQAYGYWTSLEPYLSCKSHVTAQLAELHKHFTHYVGSQGSALDNFFNAEQNAVLVKNAEHYYRSLFSSTTNSWNVRDHHMMDTLDAVRKHLETQGLEPKVVVWAHNSHVGDARATEMAARGEINIGQLVREKYDRNAFIIGFTTHSGSVSAASDWGKDVERKTVRPALTESYEDIFHQVEFHRFLLFTDHPNLPKEWFTQERLERAIGVIYRPETERWSHYFHALMPQQFDAVIHIDKSQAVKPLDVTSQWIAGEFPDTYPTGE